MNQKWPDLWMRPPIRNWSANKEMIEKIFSDTGFLKKRARTLSILWTLLIFLLCFLPAREIPDLNVPLADKWTHFILFGVFSFLWLLSFKKTAVKHTVLIFIISSLLGWGVEELQGTLSFLGRAKDVMDIVADAIGGLLGAVLFYFLSRHSARS